jgi:hypothetical protein
MKLLNKNEINKNKIFLLDIFLLTIVVFIFASCNNNKKLNYEIANQKITNSNLITITEQIANDNSFKQEDIELFINAITRFGNERDSIIGKTVSQLIDEQRDFALNRVVETLKSSGARITLFLNHKFNYEGIKFDIDSQKRKINAIVFDITNTSDKEIKQVEGVLQFLTPYGELVKFFNIKTASLIPVSKDGKGIIFSMPFLHDDNSPRDMLLRTSKDLSTVWTPTLIEFTDGTKIVDIATAQK